MADNGVPGKQDLETILSAARQSPLNLFVTAVTLVTVLSNLGYTLVKVPAAEQTDKMSERVAIIESRLGDLQRNIESIKALPAASDAKLSKIAESVRELNGAMQELSALQTDKAP